jgi:hypothetical protein
VLGIVRKRPPLSDHLTIQLDPAGEAHGESPAPAVMAQDVAADLSAGNELVERRRSLIAARPLVAVPLADLVTLDGLSSMWTGRPPLRVVLTKNNRFFRP